MTDNTTISTDGPPKRNLRPFGWPYPKLLLVVLVLVVGVTTPVLASTSTAGFSAYNFDWDGTSDFRELTENEGNKVMVIDTKRYDTVDAGTTTSIVIAIESTYDDKEVDRVESFVEDGGMLVVVDSGSHGNHLLTGVGASAQFSGTVVRDEHSYHRSPALPVATDISDHSIVSTVDQLTLNYGTAVEPNGATPIANTSSFGYLDRDGTGELSDDEALDNYPIVTVESVGEGTVVAVGDPSLLINAMMDEEDNHAFAANLAAERETTLLDYTHGPSHPTLVTAVLTVRNTPILGAILGVVVVCGVVYVGTRYNRSDRPGRTMPIQFRRRTLFNTLTKQHSTTFDPEILRARLRDRYPEWDDEQIDRLLADITDRLDYED